MWRPTAGLILLVSGACGGGGVELITPPPSGAAPVTLILVPDPEDRATAQALAWTAGIPDAVVTIRPVDSSAAPATYRSSPFGRVELAGQAPGDYLLEVQRWLSDAERGALPARDDALGFVARLVVRVSAAGGMDSVPVPASRRRGLVISEWAFNVGAIPGIGAYPTGGFLELYNNADTTVYLDGMVIAEGYNGAADVPGSRCADKVWATDDSLGIWSRFFQAFPGRGRDYPVGPGQAVVVATDAIDHRPFFPGAIDLSAADYEFSGGVDVDNPAAPNLRDIGLISYPDGHGLKYAGIAHVAVLALSVEPSDLPVYRPGSTAAFARLPRSRIVDAVWIGGNYPGPSYQECPRLVHRVFDRAASLARGTDEVAEYQFSLSRRPVGGSRSRTMLQHTRTGFADFVRTARTPGVVP